MRTNLRFSARAIERTSTQAATEPAAFDRPTFTATPEHVPAETRATAADEVQAPIAPTVPALQPVPATGVTGSTGTSSANDGESSSKPATPRRS